MCNAITNRIKVNFIKKHYYGKELIASLIGSSLIKDGIELTKAVARELEKARKFAEKERVIARRNSEILRLKDEKESIKAEREAEKLRLKAEKEKELLRKIEKKKPL